MFRKFLLCFTTLLAFASSAFAQSNIEWHPVYVDSFCTPRLMAFADSNVGYLLCSVDFKHLNDDGTGQQSRLFRTTDGGKQWEKLTMPPDLNAFPLFLSAPTRNDLFLLGGANQGNRPVISSTDGGNTWRYPQPVGFGSPYYSRMFSPNYGYRHQLNFKKLDTALVTYDSGATYRLGHVNRGPLLTFLNNDSVYPSIHWANAATGIYSFRNDSIQILLTQDSGKTWIGRKLTVDGVNFVNGGRPLVSEDGSEMWVSVYHPDYSVLYSSNSGETWTGSNDLSRRISQIGTQGNTTWAIGTSDPIRTALSPVNRIFNASRTGKGWREDSLTTDHTFALLYAEQEIVRIAGVLDSHAYVFVPSTKAYVTRNNENSLAISLYPNPAQNTVNLQLTSADVLHVTLIDSRGIKQPRTFLKNNEGITVDLKGLPDGAFRILLDCRSGQYSLPLIVQKPNR